MYSLVLVALASSPAQPPAKQDAHTDQNTIYKRLTSDGLLVGEKEKVKFPAPSMADGLEGAKQTEIIKGLIGTEYSYAEFTRPSAVAPYLLKIRNIPGGDPKAPIRGVDVWFVAYGEFKQLQDDKFLDKVVNTNKSNNKGTGGPLKPEDLKKRDIPLPEKKNNEGYGTIEFDFLEKVRLKATGHAMWSRTDESIIASGEIDSRFLKDKEFPNEWRSINKGAEKPIGDPNPWNGAAMYVKITKLKEPAGAMFIEQHIIFVEPHGWFDGKNLLVSKLPPGVQDNVRTMRRELLKGK